MTKIYHRFFLGYLLILVDFRLNQLDILPDAIGYLLVFTGFISLLKLCQHKEIYLATFLTFVLVVNDIIPYFYYGNDTSFGISLTSYIHMMLCMLANVSVCLIIYHMSIKKLGEHHEEGIVEKLNQEEREYALINSLIIAIVSFSMVLPLNIVGLMMIITGIIGFIIQIRFIISLHKLRKLWSSYEPIAEYKRG